MGSCSFALGGAGCAEGGAAPPATHCAVKFNVFKPFKSETYFLKAFEMRLSAV